MGSSTLHFDCPTAHSTVNLNSLKTSGGILGLQSNREQERKTEGHTALDEAEREMNRYVQPLESSSHRFF